MSIELGDHDSEMSRLVGRYLEDEVDDARSTLDAGGAHLVQPPHVSDKRTGRLLAVAMVVVLGSFTYFGVLMPLSHRNLSAGTTGAGATSSLPSPSASSGGAALTITMLLASPPTDSASFQIQGTIGHDATSCLLPGSAVGRLAPACGYTFVYDPRTLARVRVVSLATSNLELSDGTTVVLAVHTHDPLAETCPTVSLSECTSAVVVDTVVSTTNP